ncbi:MAG: hypothetical protein WCS52_19325 [bacterium]
MTPNNTTIATAEKRVIKAEITTLRKALRKVALDCKRETRKGVLAKGKIDKEIKRIAAILKRETAAVYRRLSILQGRL